MTNINSPTLPHFKIMGTGSRSMVTHPHRVEIYQNLEAKILQIRDQMGERGIVLISGMAEGWDEAIAKVGMRNGIPYDVFIPNEGYGDYYWGRHSLTGTNRIQSFNILVEGARNVLYVCGRNLYENGVHSNFVRNNEMVAACDMALVYNPTSSGTRDAVSRLRMANKPYLVAPFNLQEEFVF